jgi:glutathione S-transferase
MAAADELKIAFRNAVSACGADRAARTAAAQALRQAMERVDAELAVADLIARTEPSAASAADVASDIAGLEADLRRKSEMLVQHSDRVAGWQERLDAMAAESASRLRTVSSSAPAKPSLPRS